ncbi:MAG: hypothetical protein OEM29_04115 [Thermoplasmata archaeon]|nr:hypothetical protein [Thermoplasmata archaeon]
MEKKFESDIGVRISEGSRRRSSNKVGALCAAVISCAMLLGSAAFLLPAMSSAEEGKVVSVDIFDSGDTDYLVYNVDNECLLHNDVPSSGDDVKKSTNLKAVVYPPSVNAQGKFVKFVYTASVNLLVVSHLSSDEDVVIADLTIPYASSDMVTGDVVISWTMTVDGVSWDSTDVVLDQYGNEVDGASVPTPASSSYDADSGALEARIILPVLEDGAYVNTGTDTEQVITQLPAIYEVGNVHIQVSIKVASPDLPDGVPDIVTYLNSLIPEEDAFPDFKDSTDLPVAAFTATPNVVEMGGTVSLDASTSSNAVSYAWYLGAYQLGTGESLSYTFDVDDLGDYTFVLEALSSADLKDIAEAVVSVYDSENPVAVITYDESFNDDGTVTVTFSGEDSSDNVGVESYLWLIVAPLGCQAWGYVVDMVYIFLYPDDPYSVTLTVFDEAGNEDSSEMTYPVQETPPA